MIGESNSRPFPAGHDGAAVMAAQLIRQFWRAAVALALAWSACAVAAEDADVGAPLLRIEAGSHTAAIRRIAVDREGRWLVTASEDKTARVWSLADGNQQVILRPPIGAGNDGKLYAAAMTPDGATIAVAGWSAENDVYLFKRTSGELIQRISGMTDVVNHLAFSPDGRRLVACQWGPNGIRIYQTADDWRSSRLVGVDLDYGSDSYGADFSADGNRLVSASYDGRIRLYELVEGTSADGLLRLLAQSRVTGGRRPFAPRFSPDGKLIAVGFEDSTNVAVLRGTDLVTAYSVNTLGIDGGSLNAVAWSNDGRTLYAAGNWRRIGRQTWLRRWESSGRGPFTDLPVANDTVMDLQALPNGKIAFGSAEPSWGVLAADGKVERSMPVAMADFRASGAVFQVARDGSRVGFGFVFGGRESAVFDLQRLAWVSGNIKDVAPPAATRPGLVLKNWQESHKPEVNGKPVALADGELSFAVVVDPGKGGFVLGSNWSLRAFDSAGNSQWRVQAPSACWAVNVSGDGKWVIAAFGDGTIRWFRRDNGSEVLAFFPHGDRKRWVLWTAAGYFAASEGGDELVGWHKNRGRDRAAEFYLASRFSERYYNPSFVVSALAGLGAVPNIPAGDLRKGFTPAPAVRIENPQGGKVAQDRITVVVFAEERGGGIDEIRLYHNGKAVPEDPGQPKRSGSERKLERRFTLDLVDGANIFRALAMNNERTESASAEVSVDHSAASLTSSLHVLAIGINKYKNGALDLDFSVPDANGIASFFRKSTGPLFKAVKVDELYDGNATKANILAGLRSMANAGAQDVVLVFLAGHGETVKDEWYFVPHELTAPERDTATGGLSSHELGAAVKAIPARKVLVMIDACKSGAAAQGFRGLEDRKALAQLSRAAGIHLIAASTKDQLAAEVRSLGHGTFTYTILDGLGGKAAAGERDITARKLMVYVEKALPEVTSKYHGEEQYPVVSSTGMDFPLVLY